MADDPTELYNALFYVNERYGFRYATATVLDHGTSIIPQTEGSTRRYSVWFSKVVTSSSFGVELTWATRAGRDDFMTWLEQYIIALSDPNVTGVPMMSIYIRMPEGMDNFTRIAVPTEGMDYQYSYDDVSHAHTIKFVGTSDPIFKSLRTQAPGDPVLEKLYPGGYTKGSPVTIPALYDLPSELEIRNRLNGGPGKQWFSARRIAGDR